LASIECWLTAAGNIRVVLYFDTEVTEEFYKRYAHLGVELIDQARNKELDLWHTLYCPEFRGHSIRLPPEGEGFRGVSGPVLHY
jgi:hypothetical protein